VRGVWYGKVHTRCSSADLTWEHQVPGDVSRVASAVLKGKRLADRATTAFRSTVAIRGFIIGCKVIFNFSDVKLERLQITTKKTGASIETYDGETA
jgi:hypothetical protein